MDQAAAEAIVNRQFEMLRRDRERRQERYARDVRSGYKTETELVAELDRSVRDANAETMIRQTVVTEEDEFEMLRRML